MRYHSIYDDVAVYATVAKIKSTRLVESHLVGGGWLSDFMDAMTLTYGRTKNPS
jgi:hypothetical protein